MPACRCVLRRAGRDPQRREHGDKAAADPLFDRDSLARLSAHYLAGADPRQALVSPAVVGDLAGLPPTLLQVGTNEVLLDDSTRFATRAANAGVEVILDVTADVPHVFQSLHAHLGEAVDALDRAADFVRATSTPGSAGQGSEGRAPIRRARVASSPGVTGSSGSSVRP